MKQKTEKDKEKTGGLSSTNVIKPRAKLITGEKSEVKKPEVKEEEAYHFPPFQFDNSTALKHKLVLNLRNC